MTTTEGDKLEDKLQKEISKVIPAAEGHKSKNSLSNAMDHTIDETIDEHKTPQPPASKNPTLPEKPAAGGTDSKLSMNSSKTPQLGNPSKTKALNL